tara:strand:- start:64 stop:660 length:597 start_codon:yes stop_codon:yes gene_type:complete
MYKINKLLSCVLLLALFFSSQLISAEDSLSKNISKYINELTQFSCNFIQSNPDGSISEGSMIYSENKIRVNYTKPYNVTFVAKKNKAMYFNKDLMELHYFNPNKTAFSMFKSFFELHNMPKDTYKIVENNNVINVELKKIEVDNISNFSIIFQNNPIELKKIKWSGVDGDSTFSIYNLNSEIIINKKTFSMLNPIINN